MKTSNVTQVATFEKLLGFCNAQGAMYNPPKDSMKVAALNSLLTSAQQSVQVANSLNAAYGKAVAERSKAFDELPKFMTRLIFALKAADVPLTTVIEAYRYKKRFVAKIKSRPAQDTPKDAANGDPPAAIKTTRVQRAYSLQIDNFETMIKFIATEPAYTTTDPTLTISGLGAYLENLSAKNKIVLDAFAALSAARKSRDKVLYSHDGIFTVGAAVKYYVKSTLGTQNATSKEVGKMQFLKKFKV